MMLMMFITICLLLYSREYDTSWSPVQFTRFLLEEIETFPACANIVSPLPRVHLSVTSGAGGSVSTRPSTAGLKRLPALGTALNTSSSN